MLQSSDELVILYLMDADPDVVVDLLEITTPELLEKFPEHVKAYLEREVNEDDVD